MATTRMAKTSDATWCRAWVCDTTAERTALAATWTAPGGPKRGDEVLDNQDGQLYMFTNGGNMYRISGAGYLPIDLNSDVTGILPVANGGTGDNTINQGDLYYGSATGVVSRLAKNTNATRYVSNQGTSNNPSWNQINLANGVTGTLADGNLSSNIPLKNGTNAFTGANSFATNPVDLLVGQIKFPATQNPSSNVNTLDDYEEGAWTPTDASGASLTFSGPLGRYIKIGTQVLAWAVFTYPSTASGANALWGGLPFTSLDYFAMQMTGVFGYNTALTNMTMFIYAGNTAIQPVVVSTASPPLNSALSTHAIIIIASYIAAD